MFVTIKPIVYNFKLLNNIRTQRPILLVVYETNKNENFYYAVIYI